MVTLDKSVFARYSKDGKHFEIYVDPVKALEFKQGRQVSVTEFLAVDAVFKDARKGDHASESALKEVFGTSVPSEVAKQIVLKGEIQLTTEQRRNAIEEKKRAIISLIARESINPQTKTPHPPHRIEKAIDEARVSIDPFEKVEIQVEKVLKAIRPIIPISMERLRIETMIPPAYTGQVYHMLKKHELEKEEWLDNGCLKAVLKIPAGLESEFYSEINSICKGEAQFTRLKS